MDITFIGACRTVTGSSHLFEFEKQKFLIECGLYQGHREEAERINRTFSFKPKDIKAVILSHAHLDHCGNLPNLTHHGFGGPIYCTPATKDIAALLLLDSARIQESDIQYLNKKHKEKGLPTKEPLYSVEDAEETIRHFQAVGYQMKFEPVRGVTVTLYDAGHILGSSIILIETQNKRILFTGDLGRERMPITKDPVIMADIDHLIMESTYGNSTHKSFEGMTTELGEIIGQGKKQKSKIIIPAFAVERTQVLITMLKNLYQKGILKGVPVYVDSPLATDVTEVFINHPECFDAEAYKNFVTGDPFSFPGLHYVQGAQESKKLNDKNGPMIIIAASGMCEGGRVTHHLIHSIEDPKNMIVFTGYQAHGTLGRKILEGAQSVRIFDNEYEVQARIYSMDGLSAHADGDDLFNYVTKIKGQRLKEVYLIHGEIDEAIALQQRIESLNNIKVMIPESMTRVTI